MGQEENQRQINGQRRPLRAGADRAETLRASQAGHREVPGETWPGEGNYVSLY